jgi:hypothetical protein
MSGERNSQAFFSRMSGERNPNTNTLIVKHTQKSYYVGGNWKQRRAKKI